MKSLSKVLRRTCAAIMLAGACFGLAACGDEGDPSHTVVFYHTMGDDLQTVLKTAISKFETKYPGWKIQSSKIGGYDQVRDAVVADLSGHTQPDLAYCYSDHVAQYLTTGKVVDMTKYINSTEKLAVTAADGTVTEELIGFTAAEIADFVPGYYAEGKATNYANYEKYGYTDSAMFTLPFVKSTEVLYYNADALIAVGEYDFDEDGNKVARVPATWDELWAVCAKVKKMYPKSTPLGYDSEANWFITMCEQNGWGYTQAQGNHYVFNTKGAQDWFDQLKKYYDLKYFTTQNVYGSYTSNLFVTGAETGTIFSIGSSGGASHQASDKFNWGVAPIPGSVVNGKVVNKAISQGPNLVMFQTEDANATEKELMTWEFVKMLMDPTFQASFSIASGYNPSRQASFDIEEYKDHLADDTNIVAVTANVAKSMSDLFFTSPAFVGSSTARTQVGTAIVYVVTGQKTSKQALEDAMSKCGA